MKILLEDSSCRAHLVPFSKTNHVADFLVGIFTMRERWHKLTGAEIFLQPQSDQQEMISVPANIIPTKSNYKKILQLCASHMEVTAADARIILYPWNIFQYNGETILEDFKLLAASEILLEKLGTHIYADDHNCVYIGCDVIANHVIFNTADGPVVIDDGAQIMEGTCIKGPAYIGKNSIVKMGAKIYQGTSIGPHCVVGGEIKNTVLFGYSNKAHDGYLGDSVIGQWCNLGAGTSCSNVKNTGSNVTYNLDGCTPVHLSSIKGGLLMGDYSRSAINTAFNTASVVGVCCNIFGENFSKKYFPDFSWGDDRYVLQDALTHIKNWKQFKNKLLSSQDAEVLSALYKS